MNPDLQTAIIAAAAAVLGSLVAGIATYRAALVGFQAQRTRKRLRSALQDLDLLLRVEEKLVSMVSETTGEPVRRIKMAVRDEVTKEATRKLHQLSEPARLSRAIEELSSDD